MFAHTRRISHLGTALVLALATACQEPATLVAPAPAALGGKTNDTQDLATVKWNEIARSMVMKYNTSAPATIRLFALLTVSQYNSIVEADKTRERSLRAAHNGAIAGASATVLSYIYPQEAGYFESLVDEQNIAFDELDAKHQNFEMGEAVGRTIAAGIVDRAKTDRFFDPFTGTVPTCDGCWLPTTPPAFATLGKAKPFMLASANQFRPAPPPAFNSPEYVEALAEVRQIADTRTKAQDSIAKFWALGAGTVSAQGYLNMVASNLVVKYDLSERDAAHTLALLNISAFDAIIASHEAKYHYWLIRPSQADAMIVRAIGLPSFPSYPSNHSALVASAAEVLGAMFPGERAALDAMADEGALSRLYGGIHYRFDTEAGKELGRRVASWTLAHDVHGKKPFVLQ
jgi:membrane-associated phospholipid phosphatase